MSIKIESAETSYSDLRGTIAIDFPGDRGKSEFIDYVTDLGIDLDKYDPQGIEIYRGEDFDYEDIRITIIAVDKSKQKLYQKQNNNRLPVVKLNYVDNFTNFMKSIHRMHIVLLKGYTGDSNAPENLDIVEEINYE